MLTIERWRHSLMTDTSDSGMGTQGTPSERGLDTEKSETQSVTYEVWNSLHSAAKTGDITIIEAILSRGQDINSKDNDGNTPLALAAACGRSEAINYLLRKGADPFERCWFRRNSLHAASEAGNVAIIQTLLSRGLEVNSRDHKGNMSLTIAVQFNKSEAITYLLEKGADTSTRDSHGRNALLIASRSGNVAIIETMLSSGLDIDSKIGLHDETPLAVAALSGKSEAVHHLLEKGADPSIKNVLGAYTLHSAILGGNVVIIEKILSRFGRVNSKDNYGETPLMLAAHCGNLEAVHSLLERGADSTLKSRLGRNALHSATKGGSVAVIQMMLSRGLKINSKDREGDTPLMVAAECGKIEAVHYLLEKRAARFIAGYRQRNLLHAAAKGGNVAIIEAMSCFFHINSEDSFSETPLIIAASHGRTEAVQCLLEKGADSTLKGRCGKNPLHFAVYCHGNVAIIDMLFSHGLDINSKDSHGEYTLNDRKESGQN